MKKWEYKKVSGTSLMKSGTNSISVEILQNLGEVGWELCGFTNWNDKLSFAYFKRELKPRKKK